MPTPFINPYNFVRHDNNLTRINKQRGEPVSGHDKYSGLSGRLTCTITTLSRIFVGASAPNRNLFNSIGGLPVIQGSSLKGVIRSVAEAISSSCFTMISKEYDYFTAKYTPTDLPRSSFGITYKVYKKNRNGKIKNYIQFSHSSLLNPIFLQSECKLLGHKGLCITCRLFGSSTDDEQSQSFGGKVAIGDAKIFAYYIDSTNQEISINSTADVADNKLNIFKDLYKPYQMLLNPKPHHEAFYLDSASRKIRGRKFYYHQSNDRLLQNGNDNERIEVVAKNVIFQFTVDFQNLSEKELGLLCLAIQLESDMAHKIGMGKPIGLGSAKITIKKIEEFDTSHRYKKLQNTTPLTDLQQITKVDGWVKSLKDDSMLSFYENGWNDLKAILPWPPYSHTIEYPTFIPWFRNNGSIPLPSAQDVASGINMLKK